MTRFHKWLIGGLGAAVIAGAGIAGVAAAQSSTSGSASGPSAAVTTFIADVAKHLGVQPSALQSAIRAAQIDRVHQLQSSGKITATQAENKISRIQSGKAPLWPGFGHPGPHGPGGAWGGKGPGGVLPAAAQYLGITPQQLMTELQSGKTLSQIADATPNKSVSGLTAALTAAQKARLDQAVKDGRITSAQEQAMLSKFQARLQQLVTQPFPARRGGPGMRHGGWGPAPGGAAPASSSASASA